MDEIKIGACAETGAISLDFAARSFLHHQVRNMVGTLVENGLGRPCDINRIFAAKSRAAAGPTAPAHGLYFVSAEY
jgi:tRNA pseudouridine38-40 synthase